MLENPYGLNTTGRLEAMPGGGRFSVSPRDVVGRVLSPRGSRQPSMMEATKIGQLGVSAIPGGYSGALSTSGVREAMTLGPIRGQSRTEYVPYERKYIDYESVERVQKVPVERMVIDYQEQKKVQYVPRQRTITDYYAVEHQVNYIPRSVPETKIQYVPVETVTQRIEYVPVERQVVHYPEDFQFGKQQVIATAGSTLVSGAAPMGLKGSGIRPFAASFQQQNRSISTVSPLQIESHFKAGMQQGMEAQQPVTTNRQSNGMSKFSGLNTTQQDSNGGSSLPYQPQQKEDLNLNFQNPQSFKNAQSIIDGQEIPTRLLSRGLPKISEARDPENDQENLLESSNSENVLKGLKSVNTERKEQQQQQFQIRKEEYEQQRMPTPPPHLSVHQANSEYIGNNQQHQRPTSSYSSTTPSKGQSKRANGGIRLTLNKEGSRRSNSQAPNRP